jgi:hypothetical protein
MFFEQFGQRNSIRREIRPPCDRTILKHGLLPISTSEARKAVQHTGAGFLGALFCQQGSLPLSRAASNQDFQPQPGPHSATV